jgi:hypothetical protein
MFAEGTLRFLQQRSEDKNPSLSPPYALRKGERFGPFQPENDPPNLSLNAAQEGEISCFHPPIASAAPLEHAPDPDRSA